MCISKYVLHIVCYIICKLILSHTYNYKLDCEEGLTGYREPISLTHYMFTYTYMEQGLIEQLYGHSSLNQ